MRAQFIAEHDTWLCKEYCDQHKSKQFSLIRNGSQRVVVKTTPSISRDKLAYSIVKMYQKELSLYVVNAIIALAKT
ncbi:hypothetical protein EB796_001612 [Bugula neritina]|uniref:Uncharacterized protein n=1 Tax=Bugula neritina TaxID=10212 RepID=A0A7J7KPH6_BUGNE|nr:hypothetical protein EB796_001612 [Bugula neritina]